MWRIRNIVLISCLAASCSKSWGKFWDVVGATDTPSAITPIQITLAPLYSTASNWNDYVANDGATQLAASGATCTGSETGHYNACIHAGVMRSAALTNISDCTGVTATDMLDAFNWLCDSSTATPRIVLVGLQSSKGLSNLLNFTTPGWLANSVEVFKNGARIAYSNAATWWANPVQAMTTAGGSIASAGIYVVTGNLTVTTNISLNIAKSALVVRPGFLLASSAGPGNVVFTGFNFHWVEGAINANGQNTGVFVNGSKFSVLRNVSVMNANASSAAIVLQSNADRNRFDNVRIANIAGHGLNDSSGTGNIFNLINTSGAPATKANFFLSAATARDNCVTQLVSGSGTSPVYMLNASSNLIGQTSLLNGDSTVILMEGANNTTFANLLVSNASGASANGLLLSSGVVGSKFSLINFLGSDTITGGSNVINDGNGWLNTYYSGTIKLANAAASLCLVGAVGDKGMVSNTCVQAGSSDFGSHITGFSVASTIRGKVTTNDSANQSETNGLQTFATISDWLNFDNFYRYWGIDGSPFPNPDHGGKCSGGNCRIWDVSLNAADTVARNTLAIPNGNNTYIHVWSAVSQPACTFKGAHWAATGFCSVPPYGSYAGCVGVSGTYATGCYSTILRNAYEIFDDGIGNDNGLCESNEACIYTPNIGAYQGHGNLTCIRGPASAGCATTFTNGAISGVTLYQYATNGY